MATSTLQSPAASPSPSSTPSSVKNPQLKRVVYSKYRELLGSYNDKANAIIDTLPAYMVRQDRGFQLSELPLNADGKNCLESSYGQRGGGGGGGSGGGGYEAPACVQNAMMTKDKKPFTYTPGGIDLSQIRSERMAKRLARNAQSEGATGAAQQNRPAQPQSPGGATSAANAMGAAAMGMPFQVLPPPPPPQPQTQGKNGNQFGAAAAPPPPPPQQPSTLAPPTGRLSAPGSPATARKSPTPQRFEPPPLGFRPEIKIPTNPMAALRKVPPPVEKNTFWKDEYVKDRSKSPLPETSSNQNGDYNGGSNYSNSDAVDGPKSFDNSNNNNNSNSYSPMQQQQQQQQQKYPTPPETPLQQQQQQLQEQQSPRQEFRSVAMPTSPSVSVYTRQAESPRSPFERQTESPRSPFEQQRPPAASSPLAQAPQQQQQQAAQSVPWRTQRAQPAPQQQQQQSAPQHPQPIYNNVQQQQQQQQQLQQQQQQRSRDVFSPGRIETSAATNFNAQPQQQQNFGQQQAQYPGATKPTNVGSLYIAPLAQPTEPQAQRILLQQQQQTRESRDSPMRQLPQQQQPQSLPQQQQPQGNQPLRWLSSQPASKEQAPWARPEENGNVLPSTLRQTTPAPQPQPQVAQQQAPQSQTSFYQPQLVQGNGYGPTPGAVSAAISQQNFGSHPQGGGLRLQINLNTNGSNNNATQSAPRERIIPITLEQTPTYAAAQPNFGGYNNYPAQSSHTQWREPSSQRVLSPNLQPPTGNGISSNGNANANAARIIPISIEGGRGGPVSQSPVLLQNGNYNVYVHQCPLEAEILYRKNRLSDPRSPPIQSKSFRILQKITDTVDDGSGGDPPRQESPQQPVSLDGAGVPQLQRPQFARQMSAQQARNSPTIEQMRRLQLAQDQQQSGTPLAWSPQGNGVSAQNRFTPQHYDSPQQQTQQYVPPSEQQVPEPKKYTGSAIPSRSFKILQAMTTPENAEHKIHTELDSDLENVELNEIPNNNNNNNYNQNTENNHHNKHSNEINSKTNKRHSYTSSTVPPTPSTPSTPSTPITDHTQATYSSNSSLSSADSSCPPRSQSVPPHYPYAYGYPYPWYMPPPPGEAAPMANWPYPYHYPAPPPPPHAVEGKPADGFSPYPYYYPYPYPPTMPPYGQHPNGCDAQPPSGYPPFHAMPPYGPYPYPVAPSFSQSSNEESRASSVLPDIIITPSTDDMPSQVIMQHHVKVEPRESPKRAHSVEIEELVSRPKTRNICSSKHEVIDMLSQRLANINKIAGGNTQANLSKQLQKDYAGEQSKELVARSPSENASIDDSDSEEETSDSEDSEDTPKHASRPAPLQAIKSVTNVQVYKGKALDQHLDSESSDDEVDEGDEDVTTADEEMDDDYIVEEDLSVIYEEESELERSSEYAKTVIRRDDSRSTLVDDIEKQIEDNDQSDNDDDDGSNSVTVRLPLRFSFSRSSNDENIATVQVGNTTQIEERRQSIASSAESKRSSFSVAMVESADEDGEDDCEVSVTISLSNSSRSNSVEKYRASGAYPIEEIAAPLRASRDDVSASFSLGMRNKFLGETIANDVTNNISPAKPETDTKAKTVEETVTAPAAAPTEEFDFFATLMATKMQAQKMMEQSKNFWKTTPEPAPLEPGVEAIETPNLRAKENCSEAKPPRPKSADMSKTQASLEAAKNSFWSTFATASQEQEHTAPPEEKQERLEFYGSIENKETAELEDKQWTKKKKTVTYTPLKKETATRVEHWTTTLRAHVVSMPLPQKAEVHFVVEEKPKEIEKPKEKEPNEDFWASVQADQPRTACQEDLQMEDTFESQMDIWNGQEAEQQDGEDADFWADNKSTTSSSEEEKPSGGFAFDPTKYPEEPREVDTDEEIDFWAEIEAKRQPDDDDDVTFHKSATFWARKERQNSVEETPYKPVEIKAFRAKLPDEPAVAIDVWATLEAARGAEPEIVDPIVEQEKELAEQYEELPHDTPVEKKTPELPEEVVPESNLHMVDTMSLASMHEPATVYTWAAQPQESSEDAGQTDFWADIEEDRAKKEQVEEADQKRQNYRKAMAFFNTSIDGQQSPPQPSTSPTHTPTPNRHSVILEEAEPQEVDLGPPGPGQSDL